MLYVGAAINIDRGIKYRIQSTYLTTITHVD